MIGTFANTDECTDHYFVSNECVWCGQIATAMSVCEHNIIEDCICLNCGNNVTIFIEDINVYERDLAANQKLNNFNYVTNLLPLAWRQILVDKVQASGYKFINRTIIKTLPTDMLQTYILPRIANSKNKSICRPCGKLYTKAKSYLHQTCHKDRSDTIV